MLYISRVYRHTLPFHLIGVTVQLPTFLTLNVSNLEQTAFDAGGMQVVPHSEQRSCRVKSSRETAATESVTFVTSPRCPDHVPMKGNSRIGILTLTTLWLCFVVQLGLAFGLAGLFWPDKFMPLFETLMFPWAASRSAIRANGIATIGLSLLLLVARLTGNR
jgi:hypothetical protein